MTLYLFIVNGNTSLQKGSLIKIVYGKHTPVYFEASLISRMNFTGHFLQRSLNTTSNDC